MHIGSRGEACDRRRRPQRAKGEVNLRARALNCLTNNAFHTLSKVTSDKVSYSGNDMNNHDVHALPTDTVNTSSITLEHRYSTYNQDVVQETSVDDPAAEVVTRASRKNGLMI